jgi:hypothetical protein
MSVHPTTTTAEIEMVCDSIKSLAANHATWASDYSYNKIKMNLYIRMQNHLKMN